MTTRRDFLRGLGMGAVALATGMRMQETPDAEEALLDVVADVWRESVDLTDVIYSITPTDTPLLSVLRARGGEPLLEWDEEPLGVLSGFSGTAEATGVECREIQVCEAEFGDLPCRSA